MRGKYVLFFSNTGNNCLCLMLFLIRLQDSMKVGEDMLPGLKQQYVVHLSCFMKKM